METEDLIGYDEIIENSMRNVMYEALKKVEKSGLPGEHYFMITFLTRYEGAKVSSAIKDKYPEEMTIALQYQFQGLVVNEDYFEVSLSFGGKFERLKVPFKAITSFSDPPMNFVLRFTITSDDIDTLQKDTNIVHLGSKKDRVDSDNKNDRKKVDLSAKVISLDAFKKNNPDKK
jgi:hypothetical protein